MGFKQTDSLAVLEELVPRPGWRTDVALFSSYSVDLVAVAAVAMALAAEGDDDERMWKGSLARSCEKMRDRYRVVCQGGRVAVPPSGALNGLVVADQWVRQVPYDGNRRSWHAKLGIVRYVPEEPDESGEPARWLLWMGSRNLTRDTSWDSAMTATGRSSRAPDGVDRSVAEAAAIVAGYAALPGWTEDVQRELGKVHWTWPAEIDEVVAFRLWTVGDAAMVLPELPTDSSRIVALCPFFDPSMAKAIGRATAAQPDYDAAYAGGAGNRPDGARGVHERPPNGVGNTRPRGGFGSRRDGRRRDGGGSQRPACEAGLGA